MFIRLLVAIFLSVLLLAALLTFGLYRAQRENQAIVRSNVEGPSSTTTIDLRPHAYAELPAPVRRYFDFAFSGHKQVTVDWTEWLESGDFLLPVGKFQTAGHQYNRAQAPVYAWTGTFSRYGVPLLESRDAFFLDRHDMRAKLFGWLKIMHTDYEDNEKLASLHSYLVLRYYGQAPLMPWALLPNEYVGWVAKDEGSAYLEVTRKGLEARYLVTFGPDGRIDRMETDRLLMEGNGTMQKEVGLKLDYGQVNGFVVPSRMDYRWTLADGSLASHYQFEVSGVRYLHR